MQRTGDTFGRKSRDFGVKRTIIDDDHDDTLSELDRVKLQIEKLEKENKKLKRELEKRTSSIEKPAKTKPKPVDQKKIYMVKYMDDGKKKQVSKASLAEAIEKERELANKGYKMLGLWDAETKKKLRDFAKQSDKYKLTYWHINGASGFRRSTTYTKEFKDLKSATKYMDSLIDDESDNYDEEVFPDEFIIQYPNGEDYYYHPGSKDNGITKESEFGDSYDDY